MEPRITTLPSRTLIGMHLRMDVATDRTGELWRTFMPRRREIQDAVGVDLFSLRIYDPALVMADLTPFTPFDKWAAVEVHAVRAVPPGMDVLKLDGGLHAVFLHQGSSAEGARVFGHIYGVWAPSAPYIVDNTRPHFEVLGAKYKNNDPSSEEEIWIPIRPREQG